MAAEFDVHRLSTFARSLQEQQVQALAAGGHLAFRSIMPADTPNACKTSPLLSVSMLQKSKRTSAANNLIAAALSILVDTFRLAASAVGANNLQGSPLASNILQ